MSDNDLRERIAALEHEQWAHWTRHFLAELAPFLGPEGLRLHCVRRWQRQTRTPYADLTEAEKDSDREWADRVLAVLGEDET